MKTIFKKENKKGQSVELRVDENGKKVGKMISFILLTLIILSFVFSDIKIFGMGLLSIIILFLPFTKIEFGKRKK